MSPTRIRPAQRLILLTAIWALSGFLLPFFPDLIGFWGGLLLVFGVGSLVDLARLWKMPVPQLERVLPSAFALGEPHPVTLRLANPSSTALPVSLAERPPATIGLPADPISLRLPPGTRTELHLILRPFSRGDFELPPAHLLLASPMGIWERREEVGPTENIRVFPNFQVVIRAALVGLERRTAEQGVHLQRRRGEGLEFLQLREYREGDSLRQIDWKATSRRGQLVSREYREEQNQQVIFVLDCGRRMSAREGERAHFDHVLDAVLLLTWAALRQGDAVGLLTFSGHERWLPPRKGRAWLNELMEGVYDLQPTDAPSDYAEATARLGTHQRRRALIVLVTNLRDDDAKDLPAAIAPLRKRHLVLLASLRESALLEATRHPIETVEDGLRVAGAHAYLEERHTTHRAIASQGIQLLDVEPPELPNALVHRYLDIKRAGLL